MDSFTEVSYPGPGEPWSEWCCHVTRKLRPEVGEVTHVGNVMMSSTIWYRVHSIGTLQNKANDRESLFATESPTLKLINLYDQKGT